tara:strand:- start:1426 stop:3027 length:1602 start_codon:yes stop_codon:yes gene_type:complete
MGYKILNLAEFAKNGINSDLQPWDLPGSFLTQLNNIRIRNNELSPFGGKSTWATLPVDFVPGMIMPAGSVTADFWLIAGQDKVYSYNGTVFEDISSIGFPGVSDADLWTGCLLAAIPILNNPGNYPQYWSPASAGTDLQELPWDATRTWDVANQSARLIRSHKQFLFAMDLVDTGISYQDAVAWSAPADIGGLPETWDYLDTTNVAGRTWLGADGGRIVDGLSLRDAFCVYRESGISIFDYVGGNFVWQIRHLSSTIGLIAPESIAEVKGVHFLIGDGDILRNDGNQVQSLLHNRLRNKFTSDYNPDTYANSYALKNNTLKEVWFCVPDAGATYPTLAYIYNWRDDSWSIRDIPEGPHANYGPVSTATQTWTNVVGNWEDSALSWGRKQATPLSDTLVQCTKQPEDEFGVPIPGTSGKLFLLDRSALNLDEGYDSVIERIGFALEGMNNVTTITRIYPHMIGPGSVMIEVGSQDFPGAPVRWKPAVEFNADTDRKVDIRTTGELHAFRFTSTDSTVSWRLSGMDIEYVNAGNR